VDEPAAQLIGNIDNTEDLRRLDSSGLNRLADELRAFLIHEISERGGHFGANLGVVELTVALHYVFQTPFDSIIWDVGHQAYAHKVLTGRRRDFAGNRRLGGISGFPSRAESPHDAFGTGHASTSIGAAIGIAQARKKDAATGRAARSIAVIGDGALTGGLAFEALNQLGGCTLPVLVIVNDNQMSIDPNVGGISRHLSHLKQNAGIAGRNSIFENLDIPYRGCFDGHDIQELLRVFREWDAQPVPCIIHLSTLKGKGFAPAEEEQTRWHATGKFDKVSGRLVEEPIRHTQKYQDVFGQTLLEMAERNANVVGITAAMPSGTSLKTMADRLPHRCFDVGIAEAHAVTFAAGMATQGLRPFVAIYSTFLQRAYDQVIHDVALQKLPVVFCIDRAGLAGADGPTHHGAFDLAYLSCIPNLTVAAPRNAWELRLLMYTALNHVSGPFAIRYPRGYAPDGSEPGPMEPLLNYTAVPLSPGQSGLVISVGPMATQVGDALDGMGQDHDIAHWDVWFIKPIDPMLLTQALSQPFVLVVEDGCRRGGVGATLGHELMEAGYRGKFQSMALPDAFIPQGSPEELYRLCGLDAEGIRAQMNALLGK